MMSQVPLLDLFLPCDIQGAAQEVRMDELDPWYRFVRILLSVRRVELKHSLEIEPYPLHLHVNPSSTA